MNHFVFLSFYFGAKNGSPALSMANLLVVRRVSPSRIIHLIPKWRLSQMNRSGSSCMKTRHRGPNAGVYKMLVLVAIRCYASELLCSRV